MIAPLHNPFKAALRKNWIQIGFWQALATPVTAEISATAGFDWLLFDGEHAPNDLPLLLAQLQAVAPYQAHAVGRVPSSDASIIKRYLDIGFQTLLIPFVETAEQAQELVRAMRYPPEGVRGVAAGLVRASRWNGIPGYLDSASAETCLIVQIETSSGMENLEEIVAVDGVDGVFIGPADLSASMGFRGQPSHPAVAAQIERAVGVIRAADKAAGLLALDPAAAEHWISVGYSFVAVGTDVSLFAGGVRDLARRFGADGPEPRGAY